MIHNNLVPHVDTFLIFDYHDYEEKDKKIDEFHTFLQINQLLFPNREIVYKIGNTVNIQNGVWLLVCIMLAVLVSSCNGDSLPTVIDPPVEIPDLPGIPSTLRQIPELLEELNLPDLTQITDLPEIEDLPFLPNTPPGSIIYNGPTEKSIEIGQKISGTDIELASIEGDQAEFYIAGLRSLRTIGDSLDFDGKWPGTSDLEYSIRLRIYRISKDNIRVAGVHQLLIPNIQPVISDVAMQGFTLKFPFTTNANVNEMFAGMTYGYASQENRGANISGLPADEYPYRKIGDSVRWRGLLRSDIPVTYNIRLLFYNDNSARVGGTVTIELPAY